jgi:RES domain-containing protein
LGVPPDHRLPRDLWRLDIDLQNVANLTDAEVLKAHGIDNLLPTRRQWPATQRIGETYWRNGASAVLVPSAARQGGRVLAVFRATAGNIAGVRPVGPATSFSTLPPLPTGLRT